MLQSISGNPVPQLQERSGKQNVRVCRWLIEGLWHGVVCFFVPLLALGQSRKSGITNGLFSYGVATYTALIIIVNLKVRALLYPPRRMTDYMELHTSPWRMQPILASWQVCMTLNSVHSVMRPTLLVHLGNIAPCTAPAALLLTGHVLPGQRKASISAMLLHGIHVQ